MSLTCPRCLRKVVDTVNPDEPPLFCMYCGQKLRTGSGSFPRVVMPDTGEVRSADAHGDTLAFVPASNSSGSGASGPSPDHQTNTFDGNTNSTTESTICAIAGYAFIRFLGGGGQGTVYEAESTSNGQRVAVKLLSPRLAANPSSVERFRQEGRVASQISHPRCVFVLSADTEAGRPYIIMELMPGKTLKDLVDQKGTMAFADAIDRILDVIDGLCEAHRLGVIHRDVKPSNCFLTDDGRVKIGDFGLAKSLAPDDSDNRQLTGSGAFLGTVMYASPEQIRGEPVGYDSDVYAVCGTLYYLLTGKAPFQHESLTASLAKAVSEAAPPIRTRRPDVPAELERVVLRGLDRDRKRRWRSLDDLHDALVDLQPEKQQPARPRAMVLAYIIDCIVLECLIVPLELLRQYLVGPAIESSSTTISVLDMTWPGLLITLIYFVVQEGIFGTTIGKRLLRLRVRRLRKMGPPGLWPALVRAVVFNLIWYLMFQVPEWSVMVFGASGGVLGVGCVLLAIAALLVQLRRTTEGWRGLHDFASRCRVVQRPRPPHRPRLNSHFPDPLERFHPTRSPFPTKIGGFAITGKLIDLPDGGEVWAADDRSLGRSVLIRVLASSQSQSDTTPAEVSRPTRLRVLGHGNFAWKPTPEPDGQIVLRSWIAYVAPAGSPIADVVTPECPLNWIDARPLLEQLTNELTRSQEDGTAIPNLSVEQVWVEPGGRLQLLEFPLPTGRGGLLLPANHQPVESQLALIQHVATLALEGQLRHTATRIRAPLPPHASAITNRLLSTDIGYQDRDLADLRRDLIDNHAYPPEVTASMRATHLSVQGLMLAFGLQLMFVFSGLFGLFFAIMLAGQDIGFSETERILASPTDRAALIARLEALPPDNKMRADILPFLMPERLPETMKKFDESRVERKTNEAVSRNFLNRPERIVVDRFSGMEQTNGSFTGESIVLQMVHGEIQLITSPEIRTAQMSRMMRRTMAIGFGVLLVSVPVMWAAFAFVFRGGLSMTFAGITIVRTDGRLAGRFRCAVRELVVWVPVTILLGATLWIQAAHPEWILARTVPLFLAVFLLPLYVAIALRHPSRPPQDRIMGTRLVPR